MQSRVERLRRIAPKIFLLGKAKLHILDLVIGPLHCDLSLHHSTLTTGESHFWMRRVSSPVAERAERTAGSIRTS